MLNFLITNWIALSSLTIATLGFLFTIWMNHINVMATFKWIKSTNDDSYKLLISITNLSPRTTMVTGLILNDGKQIVSDNGYDHDEIEQKYKDAERAIRDAKHEERIQEIENMQAPIDPMHPNIHLPDNVLKMNKRALISQENARYYHGDWLNPKAIAPVTLHKPENISESNNFEGIETLPGNSQIKFSYWLSESPDTMRLTFSRLLTPFHRTKSFTIPVNPKNVQKNTDVKQQNK